MTGQQVINVNVVVQDNPCQGYRFVPKLKRAEENNRNEKYSTNGFR